MIENIQVTADNVKKVCDMVHSFDVRTDNEFLIGYDEDGTIKFRLPSGDVWATEPGDLVTIVYADEDDAQDRVIVHRRRFLRYVWSPANSLTHVSALYADSNSAQGELGVDVHPMCGRRQGVYYAGAGSAAYSKIWRGWTPEAHDPDARTWCERCVRAATRAGNRG